MAVQVEPWRAAWEAWRIAGHFGPAPDTGDDEVDDRWRKAWTAAAQAGHDAIASRQAEPVITPAAVRPYFGSVLVLAVGEAPDDSVSKLQEALTAASEGVTVVTVRGVEALRTWEPRS